jgi:hypothetical protein
MNTHTTTKGTNFTRLLTIRALTRPLTIRARGPTPLFYPTRDNRRLRNESLDRTSHAGAWGGSP